MMTSPKILQLIVLAEELNQKIDNTVMVGSGDNKININDKFEAQREFGRQFKKKLRALLGELSGDLFVLKERGFDPNMWRLATIVKRDLEAIFLKIKENRPHAAAQELVDYATQRSTGSIIDNLDFLIGKHLEKTHPEMNMLPQSKHAEVNAFRDLKTLATELQRYMDQNPLLEVPSNSPPPPRGELADPSFLAPPDAQTKVTKV